MALFILQAEVDTQNFMILRQVNLTPLNRMAKGHLFCLPCGMRSLFLWGHMHLKI